MTSSQNKFPVFGIALLLWGIFDLFLWYSIFFSNTPRTPELYFLDVGQGDSQFLLLPETRGRAVKMLIDGGRPNGEVMENLEKIVSPADRYIDIVMLTHPQLDHFGGIIDVLERYKVGVFIHNGREGATAAWEDVGRVVKEKNIRTVALKQGDKLSYGENIFSIISPNSRFLKSEELNDTCLVSLFEFRGVKALFTGDIGEDVEEYLVKNYDIDADILKVGHHGSKFSSSRNFIKEVSPKIAVIQVGKNTYGHPTKETISRLSAAGAKIYRNDGDGMVKLIFGPGYVEVETEK